MASKPFTSKKTTDVIGSYIALFALIGLLIVMLFPMFIVTVNSFKTEDEYYENGPLSLPERLNTEAIRGTWERTDFDIKLKNSLIISLTVALLGIGISLMNAFALGIGKVKGKSFFLVFFLLAITLPPESLAYPLYYTFKYIGLYNTRTSVILVSAVFHSAFGTYLLTSVFQSFNKDILEAAMIDGCNKFQLLFRIVVPLNMPALSVLFVFFFIWTWNDFFLPLILLVSNSNQTVPVAVALARSERSVVITSQSSAAFLGILPAFIFFLLFQRTLTRGITAGSVK